MGRERAMILVDVALRDHKLAFHKGKEPPVVQRFFTDAI